MKLSLRFYARTVIVVITASLALVGCGSESTQTTAPGSVEQPILMQVALVRGDTSNREKTVPGENLLDLTDRWVNWAGAVTDVRFDEWSGQLRIAAPVPGEDIVFGVRRFDQPLAAGAQYQLTVTASNRGAAAVLFLFDRQGTIVPISPSTAGTLAMAREDAPLTFIAPDNISGFYLQVQNEWRTTRASDLNAQLTMAPDDIQVGDNLVELSGYWPDWSGHPTDVKGVYSLGRSGLLIPPPASAQGNTIAVRRFAKPLIAGARYQLSAAAESDPMAAALLFLFDRSGQIIPFSTVQLDFTVDPAPALRQPWLTATTTEAPGFIAPEGVAGFALQVQSPWRAAGETVIFPALRLVGGQSACTPLVNTFQRVVFNEGGGYPYGSLSLSDDGNFVAFTSSWAERVLGDPSSEITDYMRADLFLYNLQTNKAERVTPASANGRSWHPSVSGNGRFVAFESAASNLIAGETDANGDVTDIFLYDRLDNSIRRVTPGNSNVPSAMRAQSIYSSLRTLSADGQVIVFQGSARDLTGIADPSTCAQCPSLLIYDRSTQRVSRPTSSDGYTIGGRARQASISASGRYISFHDAYSGIVSRFDRRSSQLENFYVGYGPGYYDVSTSDDGQVLAFGGSSENVLPNDNAASDAHTDVFVHAPLTNESRRISAGLTPGSWNLASTMSSSGEVIVFERTLGSNPTGTGDIFAYHRPSGQIVMVTPQAGFTYSSVSANGRLLAMRGYTDEMGPGIFTAALSFPCAIR